MLIVFLIFYVLWVVFLCIFSILEFFVGQEDKKGSKKLQEENLNENTTKHDLVKGKKGSPTMVHHPSIIHPS